MADPFVAEIRIFPFNFAPKGWAWCNGQLMPISQNTALFSLLGTTYGGDGKSTFALPNLQGSPPMHQGQSSGTSERYLGEQAGLAHTTLLHGAMPGPNPAGGVSTEAPTARQPPGQPLGTRTGVSVYADQGSAPTQLAPLFVSPAGGSTPHNNMQPFLTLNFCICQQGIFPPRG